MCPLPNKTKDKNSSKHSHVAFQNVHIFKEYCSLKPLPSFTGFYIGPITLANVYQWKIQKSTHPNAYTMYKHSPGYPIDQNRLKIMHTEYIIF